MHIDEETGTSAKEGLAENMRVGWFRHALSPNCLKEGSMLAWVRPVIKSWWSWCQTWLNLFTLPFITINLIKSDISIAACKRGGRTHKLNDWL